MNKIPVKNLLRKTRISDLDLNVKLKSRVILKISNLRVQRAVHNLLRRTCITSRRFWRTAKVVRFIVSVNAECEFYLYIHYL